MHGRGIGIDDSRLKGRRSKKGERGGRRKKEKIKGNAKPAREGGALYFDKAARRSARRALPERGAPYRNGLTLS